MQDKFFLMEAQSCHQDECSDSSRRADVMSSAAPATVLEHVLDALPGALVSLAFQAEDLQKHLEATHK